MENRGVGHAYCENPIWHRLSKVLGLSSSWLQGAEAAIVARTTCVVLWKKALSWENAFLGKSFSHSPSHPGCTLESPKKLMPGPSQD